MSRPRGEPGAAPSPSAGTPHGAGQTRSQPGPADAADTGRIPPQTTVGVAPETMPLPAATGPAGNGVVRPAHRVVPAPEADPGPPSFRARAGVVTRLLAAAVDAVAVVLLAVMLDLAAAGVRFAWSPTDFRWPQPGAFLTLLALSVIAVLYLSIGWALAGRTYGSKLLGLRVLSSRRELLGWIRAGLRALVCVLLPAGLLWCGISRTRSSLADVVLRTVVVYDAAPYAGAGGGS